MKELSANTKALVSVLIIALLTWLLYMNLSNNRSGIALLLGAELAGLVLANRIYQHAPPKTQFAKWVSIVLLSLIFAYGIYSLVGMIAFVYFY